MIESGSRFDGRGGETINTVGDESSTLPDLKGSISMRQYRQPQTKPKNVFGAKKNSIQDILQAAR
jgi:hypothetical protein